MSSVGVEAWCDLNVLRFHRMILLRIIGKLIQGWMNYFGAEITLSFASGRLHAGLYSYNVVHNNIHTRCLHTKLPQPYVWWAEVLSALCQTMRPSATKRRMRGGLIDDVHAEGLCSNWLWVSHPDSIRRGRCVDLLKDLVCVKSCDLGVMIKSSNELLLEQCRHTMAIADASRLLCCNSRNLLGCPKWCYHCCLSLAFPRIKDIQPQSLSQMSFGFVMKVSFCKGSDNIIILKH